jgi:hypothetical protein
MTIQAAHLMLSDDVAPKGQSLSVISIRLLRSEEAALRYEITDIVRTKTVVHECDSHVASHDSIGELLFDIARSLLGKPRPLPAES